MHFPVTVKHWNSSSLSQQFLSSVPSSQLGILSQIVVALTQLFPSLHLNRPEFGPPHSGQLIGRKNKNEKPFSLQDDEKTDKTAIAPLDFWWRPKLHLLVFKFPLELWTDFQILENLHLLIWIYCGDPNQNGQVHCTQIPETDGFK